MKPSEKLAESLDVLRHLQESSKVAIRSKDLSRTHRERLIKAGFLKEVMKGWYIAAKPDEQVGDTAWYTSYWAFFADYLNTRFGKDWAISPEQSVSLHAANRVVPTQLIVYAPSGDNKSTSLPNGCSLLVVRAALPEKSEQSGVEELNVFPLPQALTACAAHYYKRQATDARVALAMIQDASQVLALLLEGGHSIVAGRLAGAFRNIGRAKIAEDIVKTMVSAGYRIQEEDPFASPASVTLNDREKSPSIHRLRLKWDDMGKQIEKTHFPEPFKDQTTVKGRLRHIDDNFIDDAYHSLSIEGYRVDRTLIGRVKSGDWNPDIDERDRQTHNALAARGYWQAFQSVKESIGYMLDGENPGSVIKSDHGDWFRELFAPSAAAGLIKHTDLAGYRSHQVYIRRSRHVPFSPTAVRDCMPVFFDLLASEPSAIKRTILGHFIFVYIHPYMDGNGRIARFLMNAMLVSGGYPWTVIPVDRRDQYMSALEQASVEQNIIPFAQMLGGLVEQTMADR